MIVLYQELEIWRPQSSIRIGCLWWFMLIHCKLHTARKKHI